MKIAIPIDVGPDKHAEITDGLESMLFNLNDDPFETTNLIDDPMFSQIAQDLRRRLVSQLVDHDVEFKFTGGDVFDISSGIEMDSESGQVDIAGSEADDDVEVIQMDDNRVRISLFGDVAENEIQQASTFDRIVFRGLAGDDRFMNQSDIDSTAFGHSGDDILIGGNGHNRFQGGAGEDLLTGGSRNDLLRGRAGNDVIFGGRQQDRLFGGEGDDVIFGQHGRDRIAGGDGDDRLLGGSQFDRIFGGAGDDVLYGGQGEKDRLDSGPGFDRLYTTLNVGPRDNDDDDAWIQLQNFGDQANGGVWATEHVEQLDDALRLIAEQTGKRTTLFRSPDLNLPIRFNKANQLKRANRVIDGIRTLSLPDWDTTDKAEVEATISKVIRQVARSWDTVEEIEQVLPGSSRSFLVFLQQSQWRAGNNPPAGFLLSGDGRWHYHEQSKFFGRAGSNNPSADWASIWDLVINPELGENDDSSLDGKVDSIRDFFNSVGQ